MENRLFNLDELVELRRHFHKFAEIAYEEFNTGAKIKEILIRKGVEPSCIRTCAKTGLLIEIQGKGPSLDDNYKIVAFRADMDALEMKEENYMLPYRSVTKGAHMCMHDGHIVCLIGGIILLLENIHRMPSNRIARFLFQPAEEKYGGAHRMIVEGCLTDVSEIWGMHCYPYDPPNDIYVKRGVSHAGVRDYTITVYGKGGHSSLKKELIDPFLVICDLKVRINDVIENDLADMNEKIFTVCFPTIKGSESNNVIADKAVMSGLFRYIDERAVAVFNEALSKILLDLESEYKVTITVEKNSDYAMLVNDSKLVDALLEANPDVIEHDISRMGADDFADFSKIVPGCFFKYNTGSQRGNILHTSHMDFNDNCIEPAARNWFVIICNRLDFYPY